MPALPRTVATKRRKGPFPTSAACCWFSMQPLGEKSSLRHTCAQAHTRAPARPVARCSGVLPRPRAAAAPCVSLQVAPAAGTCPAAAPWPWGHKHSPCSSPWAPLWGHPATPAAPIFSLPPCLFLKVSPLFQPAKAATFLAPPLPLRIPAVLPLVFSQLLSWS